MKLNRFGALSQATNMLRCRATASCEYLWHRKALKFNNDFSHREGGGSPPNAMRRCMEPNRLK
jgi:hypothetical protein